VRRFRRKIVPKRKLPAGIQAKLARAALRAARTAAENGKCAVAEMLFGVGGGNLQAAAARARGKGAAFKVFDAGKDAADAGKAIIDCRERERAAQIPPGGTT
jgi:hypothetical protein